LDRLYSIVVIVCDGVSGAVKLLQQGADANVLGTRDASAIHLAAGAESHSDDYTALLLSHSANPNVRSVSCSLYWLRYIS